jgi:hypothetical protein
MKCIVIADDDCDDISLLCEALVEICHHANLVAAKDGVKLLKAIIESPNLILFYSTLTCPSNKAENAYKGLGKKMSFWIHRLLYYQRQAI